jgi:cell division protein FtsI (penicillin-binding protein 3)
LHVSSEMNPARRTARMRFAMAVTCAVFLVSLARLARIQLLDHEAYACMADAQHSHRVTLDPCRGRLFDRNGFLLAGNRPVVTIEVYWPGVVQGTESEIDSLYMRLCDTGAPTAMPDRTGLNQILARDIPWEQASPIISGPLPRGVNWTVGAIRTYPLGDDGAAIIGRANRDRVEGFEQEFNSLLAGEPGVRFVERSAFPGMSITDPEADNVPQRDGSDIRLTLDARFQTVVQEELEEALEMSGGSWAAAVVVDPWNGDILAMGSCPVRTGSGAIDMNRCIESMHEPGSTFKIVTLAACLEEGLLTPSDSFDCSAGRIEVADRFISDCHQFGTLTVEEIITNSSNVGTIQMAQEVPDSIFDEYCRAFGFGVPTGIELPGESSGILRPRSQWSGLSKASISIGQEVAVTPLQLAMAFCVIANGGRRIQPRLVAASREDGCWRDWATFPGRRVISEETARTMRGILHTAVDSGTGTTAAIDGLSVAGKTGTAERLSLGPGVYLSAFAGMVPADNPNIVVVVVVDRPGFSYRFGSMLAAPVFRDIVERLVASEPSLAIDRERPPSALAMVGR